MALHIRVQEAPFAPGDELARIGAEQSGIGAVVSFSGIVRDLPEGGLLSLDIEHYPGMTERAITSIAEKACARWGLLDCLVIHRHGPLRPGETIMMVGTAAAHRADAFAAAEFLMDYLKSRAPFWKREVTADGARWVEARAEDEAALERW